MGTAFPSDRWQAPLPPGAAGRRKILESARGVDAVLDAERRELVDACQKVGGICLHTLELLLFLVERLPGLCNGRPCFLELTGVHVLEPEPLGVFADDGAQDCDQKPDESDAN